MTMTIHKTWLAFGLVAIAAPASAGEISGTGEFTPVHSYRASSICSFSGLNDDGAGPSSLVQSYGALVAAFGRPNVAHSPGESCRGN